MSINNVEAIDNSLPKVGFRLLMIVFLLISGSLWGLNTTVSKFAADGGIHAFSMAFWQSVIAAVSLGVLGFLIGERVKINKELVFVCFICGSIGMTLPNAILFAAVSHVSVGIISITISLIPLVTLVMSVLIRIEQNTVKKTIGVVLGVISVLLIIVPKASFAGNNEFKWLLIILLPPLGYSVMNVMLGKFMPKCDTPLFVASGIFVSVALCSSLLMYFTPGSFHLLSIPLDTGEIATVLLGVFIFIAHSLYVYTIKKAGPVFASLGTYIITISGVFWGVIILGEKHSTWVWLSLMIIIVSLYMVQPKNIESEA